MNPTTFNDVFRACLQTDQFEAAWCVNTIRQLETAPLILHEDGSEYWHPDQFPECFGEDGILRFPFPHFRAQCISMDGARSMQSCVHMFVSKQRAGYGMFARTIWTRFFDWNVMEEHVRAALTAKGVKLGDRVDSPMAQQVYVFQEVPHGPVKKGGLNLWHPTAGWIDMHTLPHKEKEVAWGIAKLMKEYLTKLCIDWINPSLFPCKVSPKKPGKSVEWVEQRSHYVLVHKSHPANVVNAHPMIKGDAVGEEYLRRMAHARRAHFRRLRSPRFKKKVGQRIFIKATWVGPKEWEDGSGQIYRIVDLRPS